jgi:hypothetical protein
MNQFYIVLPSDSSVDFFPNNTAASFTTKLPDRISGDYEVALTEIIFPLSFPNYYTPNTLYADFMTSTDRHLGTWKMKKYAHVKDAPELARVMSRDMTLFANSIRPFSHPRYNTIFNYDKDTKKMSFKYTFEPISLPVKDSAGDGIGTTYEMTVISMRSKIKLSNAFVERFNLKEIDNMQYEGKSEFEMQAGLQLMYVYCDVLSHGTVGHIKAPLLRVVAPSGKQGEMVTMAFTNPYYIPVANHDFDTIEININTELGHPMPFTAGKTLVTLHFRRRNESILSHSTV